MSALEGTARSDRDPPFYRGDVPASVVVALVALPLCLGISLASDAPLVSGLLTGIIGGVVVGALSGSSLMVSGPAAGLTALVLEANHELGSYEKVLPAVLIGGVLQLILGALKLGGLARFVPSPVIQGMLAAIGLILILKQIPHAVGWDADEFGDESFAQHDNRNTFTEILAAGENLQWGALIVGVLSVGLLVAWRFSPLQKYKYIPAPLAVVLMGIALNLLFGAAVPSLVIEESHRVTLPGPWGLLEVLPRPDWTALSNPATWRIGVTFGLVASLESLLSLTATARIDPARRFASPDRELLAQGVGNVLSGLLGGLPLTGVIVRSSVNIDAGAKSRWSGILHGILLALAVVTMASVLSLIPLAALAGILLVTGFNLARPSLFTGAWKVGPVFFMEFVVTIVAIMFTDLLVGIIIGMGVGVAVILWDQIRAQALVEVSPPGAVLKRFRLPPHVTFFHKRSIEEMLLAIKPGERVEIDARETTRIDVDVLDLLHEHAHSAPERGVDLRMVGLPPLPAAFQAGH